MRPTLNRILVVSTFLIFIISFGFWYLTGRAAVQSPIITVQQQDDVPLQISNAVIDSANLIKPKYTYIVTNVSAKPIRVYAIQQQVIYGEEKSTDRGLTLSHLTAITRLLQPQSSKTVDGGGNSSYPKSISEIVLSVDFVEFADGSTWGEDSFKSAESLAGQRAGGKAAIKHFREKLKAKGFNALVEADETVLPEDANGKSQMWLEGFQTGFSLVRHKVKDAKSKGGITFVTQELEKPFDASEGRLQ